MADMLQMYYYFHSVLVSCPAAPIQGAQRADGSVISHNLLGIEKGIETSSIFPTSA